MESKLSRFSPIRSPSKENFNSEQIYLDLLVGCYDPNGTEKTGFLHYGKRFNHSQQECEHRYKAWLIEQENKFQRLLQSAAIKMRRCQSMTSLH